MCGIVGEAGKLRSSERRQQALDVIAHRGPDASNIWQSDDSRAWLGHRRLSIVDLSETGNQPMHNEDRTIWLVCNGEIYNYPYLRRRLENLGHLFYSQSDNECIIHAYEQWGEACVTFLTGMFAFGIWDARNKKLFLARDRLGIKPLYYAENHERIVFGSELQALYPLIERALEINTLAVAYLMAMAYIPAPHTIRNNIFKLEPGHTLTWDALHGTQIRQYWEPPRHIDDRSHATGAEWEQLFEIVLEEHLLSDVPIGLFLSGGLDSSSLALGFHRLSYPVEALTVGFPGEPGHDEAPIAKSVARSLGLDHAVFPVTTSDINTLRRKVAEIYAEPHGGSAAATMVQLCESTRGKGYKVVMGGDGGDEVFGGYQWYRRLKYPPRTPREHLGQVKRHLKKCLQRVNMFFERSALHRHIQRVTQLQMTPEDIATLFQPMGLVFGEDELLAPFEKHYIPGLPLPRRLQRVDLMTFCTDEVLFKVDRASMAFGLEVRVPFLDHRVIEYGLTLPVRSPHEQYTGKQLLRDYLYDHVSLDVLDHPKQGFSLRVLNTYDWQSAREEISEGYWAKRGLITSGWQDMALARSNDFTWKLLALTDWASAWEV